MRMKKNEAESLGEEDEELVVHQEGNSIISNSSQSTNKSTTSQEQCLYNTANFPENCIQRAHSFGEAENFKKYYFNVLR